MIIQVPLYCFYFSHSGFLFVPTHYHPFRFDHLSRSHHLVMCVLTRWFPSKETCCGCSFYMVHGVIDEEKCFNLIVFGFLKSGSYISWKVIWNGGNRLLSQTFSPPLIGSSSLRLIDPISEAPCCPCGAAEDLKTRGTYQRRAWKLSSAHWHLLGGLLTVGLELGLSLRDSPHCFFVMKQQQQQNTYHTRTQYTHSCFCFSIFISGRGSYFRFYLINFSPDCERLDKPSARAMNCARRLRDGSARKEDLLVHPSDGKGLRAGIGHLGVDQASPSMSLRICQASPGLQKSRNICLKRKVNVSDGLIEPRRLAEIYRLVELLPDFLIKTDASKFVSDYFPTSPIPKPNICLSPTRYQSFGLLS
ncbi:hypothetical protein VP01_306g2 [Puccinia sorghi]|uniref:Uncharacterized protein n=1 Tax=Puccinia sorghi TaxID=27349 RepID=A0A0L6V1K5_9BASI|nr:hypothetical protein VP01_306g2 [Puccinia sorghi]